MRRIEIYGPNQAWVDQLIERASADELDEYGQAVHVGLLIVQGLWGKPLDPEDAITASWLRVDDSVPDSEVLLRPDDLFYASSRTLQRRVGQSHVTVSNETTGELLVQMGLSPDPAAFKASRLTPLATGELRGSRRPASPR